MKKAFLNVFDYYLKIAFMWLSVGGRKWSRGKKAGTEIVSDDFLIKYDGAGVVVTQLPVRYAYGAMVPCTCSNGATPAATPIVFSRVAPPLHYNYSDGGVNSWTVSQTYGEPDGNGIYTITQVSRCIFDVYDVCNGYIKTVEGTLTSHTFNNPEIPASYTFSNWHPMAYPTVYKQYSMVPPGKPTGTAYATYSGSVQLEYTWNGYSYVESGNWSGYSWTDQLDGIPNDRGFRIAYSNNFLANLSAGAFDQVKPYIRTNHPVSQKTFMDHTLSVLWVDGQTGTGDDITSTKTVTITRTYTDPDGNVMDQTQEVVGTMRVLVTHCTSPAGQTASFTTTTYVNWMPIAASGTTTNPFTGTGERTDDDYGLFEMINGTVVNGATNYSGTIDTAGDGYTPPHPISSSTLSYSHPTIYWVYREAAKRGYRKTPGNTACRDSKFADGETLTIVPLITVHSDYGVLGVFPSPSDIGDTSKLSMTFTTAFTFRYKYRTGTWAFVKAKSVSGTVPYDTSRNVVIVSNYAAWPDVRVLYKAQAKNFRDAAATPPTYSFLSGEGTLDLVLKAL